MLNDVFPKRPFINMNFPANEKTTIVQSTNKEHSLHCYHKQARVKWSNCPFSPLPILSLPPSLIRPLAPAPAQYLGVALSTHISHLQTLSLSIQEINNQCLGRVKQKDGQLHLHTSIVCLKKGWILATSMRKVVTDTDIFTKLELFYPRLFGGIQIEDCSQPPLSSMADPL